LSDNSEWQKKRRWKVTRAKDVDAKFAADFNAGLITTDDIVILKRWTVKVEEEGPEALCKTEYWYDHPLDGEWKNCRSSSFSNRGRIIYRVIDDQVEVRVIRITPDHNYKKEG
jgi:mRNA-degrading endonuclease YafQ of YafQ-DinJ toxin-antitoxin module